MASKKKASEGIALLSMYNDEDDEEMEDMSPEIEEEEPENSSQAMLGVEHQNDNGKTSPVDAQSSPQLSDLEPPQPDTINHTAGDSEATEVEISAKDSMEVFDPLDDFLPPPPNAKCSDELQRRIDKFINLKRAGKSFNAEVRNRKDYRNPDFLLHAVRYQDIDPFGSNFSKDVFDPHGYDKSDFIDEIEADMKRERERKDQESKKNQRIDFLSAGSAIPGQAATTSASNPAPTVADNAAREGRNKKSKWDKVDGAQRNPIPAGSQDLSSVGAQAAILAANASGGYTAFAQQRRREAEEKRTSVKKSDRRS